MIGIVGAGITGLTLHHCLRKRGVESVVFEASDEPGGTIRSLREDGRLLECGPQRTRLTPVIRDLIDEVDLDDRIIEANDGPLYVYQSGSLGRAPLSVRSALRTDLLTWRGKLSVLAEPFAGPPVADESVAEYLERAFGKEFARRVAGPLYSALYATDPADMPVAHSLKRALDRFGIGRSILLSLLGSRLRGRSPPPVVSFINGLQTLPTALADLHADNISLNTAVRSVNETERGYELRSDSGTTAVDEVVLTTPAPVTASLIDGVDPTTADALRELTYNPLAVVHLDTDVSLEGHGHLIPHSESLVTRGVTWNAGLFPPRTERPAREDGTRISASTGRAGIYTCFLGGAKTTEVVDWDDDRLGAVAASEFTTVTGVVADPIRVHRLRPGMPAYDQSWMASSRIDPPPGIHLCANYESRAGIPGRVRRARRLAARLAEQAARAEPRPDTRAPPDRDGSRAAGD